MAEQSPGEAYRDALNILRDISCRQPDYEKRFRAQVLDLRSCFERLRQAAMESEDPAVWHALGNAFITGMGAERDPDQAIRWLRRAAEAGHAPAMVSLGHRLRLPRGSADPAKAFQWFRKAAELGVRSLHVIVCPSGALVAPGRPGWTR